VWTSSCGTFGEHNFIASRADKEAWLEGFTLSEFDPAKLFTAAIIDQARKHRKRPPDEARRIEEHRKTRSR
jgi:hypothetical protein